MKLLVTFRQPGRGFYKMYLSPKEIIRFSNNRARREPASKDAITNSVSTKYITSIRIVGEEEGICTSCQKSSKQLLCFNCLSELAKSKPSPTK